MTPTQIKLKRIQLGWTFSKLAKQTGVTTRAVQAYEAGEYPPKKTWSILFEKILKENLK